MTELLNFALLLQQFVKKKSPYKQQKKITTPAFFNRCKTLHRCLPQGRRQLGSVQGLHGFQIKE